MVAIWVCPKIGYLYINPVVYRNFPTKSSHFGGDTIQFKIRPLMVSRFPHVWLNRNGTKKMQTSKIRPSASHELLLHLCVGVCIFNTMYLYIRANIWFCCSIPAYLTQFPNFFMLKKSKNQVNLFIPIHGVFPKYCNISYWHIGDLYTWFWLSLSCSKWCPISCHCYNI